MSSTKNSSKNLTNRAQGSENDISSAQGLARSIIQRYPGLTASRIAEALGAKVIFEKPLKMKGLELISQYDHKNGCITVFDKGRKDEAVLHEIFHLLEKGNGLHLDKVTSESLAKGFAAQVLVKTV